MSNIRVSKGTAHAVIFIGICAAAVLDRFFGARDAALLVSIASNGIWIFHG